MRRHDRAGAAGHGIRGARQLADRRRRYCPAESCSDGEQGFTLIEALVALAIIAAVLSSIGAVIGTTVKGHAHDRPASGA